MSDLENRERAIYDYIDRAISDSTHARFDETNSRIDAINSRLDTKLEEVMSSIRHLGQLSMGKNIEPTTLQVENKPETTPLNVHERLLPNPNNDQRSSLSNSKLPQGQKSYIDSHYLSLGNGNNNDKSFARRPNGPFLGEEDDPWSFHNGHHFRYERSSPRYNRGNPRRDYEDEISPPRHNRGNPRRGYEDNLYPPRHNRGNPRHGYEDDITKKVKVEAPEFDGRLDPTYFLDWLANMEDYFDWYDMNDT